MITEILRFNAKSTKIYLNKSVQRARRPILNANLTEIYIYINLRESNIIRKNKMKVESKKSMLLNDDHEILTLFSSITKNIFNYFSCCDNFSKVKFIILYFVRLF